MIERLSISRLGQRGDGVAETPQGLFFVAGAVPGDTVTAQVDGDRGGRSRWTSHRRTA